MLHEDKSTVSNKRTVKLITNNRTKTKKTTIKQRQIKYLPELQALEIRNRA